MFTVFGAPLLIELSTSEAVTPLAKASVTAGLVCFGTFTTALLSWFVSPYVIRLTVDGDKVCATTLNVLAQQRSSQFLISDMQEPQTMRPLATFQANGKIFFIDANTADPDVLKRLGLRTKEIPQQASEDSDDD